MTGRPFDPNEIEPADPGVQDVARRLDAYVEATRREPRSGYAERVLAGLNGAAGGSTLGRWWADIRGSRAFALVQANLLAVILFLLVGFGVAVAAGQATGLFRLFPDATPGVESPSAAPDPSGEPDPSPLESLPAESGFPDASGFASPDPSPSPTPTP